MSVPGDIPRNGQIPRNCDNTILLTNIAEMNIKKYPCGTPREIVSAFKRAGMKKTCNFEISSKDLFTDASTIYEVYKAVICSIPSISKPVHFSGNCLYSSCLLDVRTGTPIKDIISTIKRRFPICEIYVFPTLVQGALAKDNISKQIAKAQDYD